MDIGGSMVQESSPQVAAQYEIFSADGDEPALQAEQDYFVQGSRLLRREARAVGACMRQVDGHFVYPLGSIHRGKANLPGSSFCKFTVGLQGCDEVLGSGRLLGFAAVERREKGPSSQAPILELVHLKKLHEILSLGSDLIDRLGAGAMLVCIYGRARWSDLRYIDHVDVEARRNKTSAVGIRREQYLPLVIPWEGVVSDDWIEVLLKVYQEAGLDMTKVPLGPFLPAPKIGGGFCARPLSTQEAARWLRLLLSGTPGSEKIRCHSLKATLLNWCAKAGLDKEVRAVLGHHSTALHGSDIVYLRELQVRPLRKLQMLLKSIRIGLNLEDIASQGTLLAATPGATTPRPNVFTPPLPVPARGDQVHKPAEEQVVEQAVELVNVEEENESIKEEIENITNLEAFACDLSLFGEEAVRQGAVPIDSSSGSDEESESSSSSSDILSSCRGKDSFREVAPAGSVYYKHVKTSRVHHVRVGKEATNCGKKLNENFKELEPVIYIRLPKCLICFPSAEGRVRTREDAIARFDAALKRARV
ncbi:Uncharacterized protein SCF082_LOCUS35661 [Durusdinium trenchii]|uniref:Tyr recombinase domain-containing protein n=3 Tax=Durusdinium trenchii TaxID=1381693 RepID=A0ABP0P8Y7_9DINO